MEEQIQQLPHLVVDEPKRSPWAVAGIAVLSLMVLSIPIGLFLVQQRTQIAPQAAVATPEPEAATGIFLESKLSPEAKGGIIPVDVYVKSAIDPINLVEARLQFDPNLLEVDKIATSAAELGKPVVFNKWLEAKSDNLNGKVVLIAGLPNPGIATQGQPDKKVYLATLLLRPKNAGSTVLQPASDSGIFRNSDNQNIFQSGSDLVLNLTGGVVEPTVPTGSKPGNNQPLVVITSPFAANNYSYFKPIEINWSSFNVMRISQINLLINGEPFGPIAQNLEANVGQFSWLPQDSLAVAYIQLANTYQFEITGVSKNGEVAKATSGPFGILGLEEVTGSSPNWETFIQNQLSVNDASRLLSEYLVLPLEDKALDFNRDDVINELDFFLLRQNLFQRGIIK